MGEKKLFSNKKKYKQQKKIQLCTAFRYNCFSIKSLLFWKEPFLTSSGGRGQPRAPSRARFGAAGAGPLFSGRRCRVKPPPRRCFFSRPFVPALRRPTALPPRHLPERPEPGARRRRGRGAPGAAGPPRRGGPDGEYRAGPGRGGAAPLGCIAGLRGPGKACRTCPAATGLLAAGDSGATSRRAGLSPLSSGWFFFFLYF